MTRRLLFAALIWLASWPALAQVPTTGAGRGAPSSSGPPPSYTGPVDIVASPTAIYALRAASAAIAAAGTQKIVNVSASGTTPANVTCDILVASNGGLANTANCSTGSFNGTAAATFCAIGSGSCIVETWYDQGGGGLNQSINTGTVALTFSCIGALPCLTFNGAGFLCNTSFPTVAQPITVAHAFSAIATNTAYPLWASNSSNIFTVFNDSSTSGYMAYRAPTDVFLGGGTIPSGLHTFQAVFNSSSSASDLDGTLITGTNPGTDGMAGFMCIGVSSGVGNYTGSISEIDVYPIAFTTGATSQMTSMNTNISAYW